MICYRETVNIIIKILLLEMYEKSSGFNATIKTRNFIIESI